MKSNFYRKLTRPAAVLVALVLCVSMFSAPVLAQTVVIRGPGYGGRPGPLPGYYHGGRPYGYPPPPHHHHGSSDLGTALAVVGTVGAIAAIANARNNRYYYEPPVVVSPRPTVVVSQPSPVVVEKQVVVERLVPVTVGAEGTYSHKLGASFRIENMQIPGYKFTAARLTSDPAPHSPLNSIGLRKGDVITRLDDNPADNLTELDRHEKNTLVRYIKTGTTKVLLANVFIPAEGGTDVFYAP